MISRASPTLLPWKVSVRLLKTLSILVYSSGWSAAHALRHLQYPQDQAGSAILSSFFTLSTWKAVFGGFHVFRLFLDQCFDIGPHYTNIPVNGGFIYVWDTEASECWCSACLYSQVRSLHIDIPFPPRPRLYCAMHSPSCWLCFCGSFLVSKNSFYPDYKLDTALQFLSLVSRTFLPLMKLTSLLSISSGPQAKEPGLRILSSVWLCTCRICTTQQGEKSLHHCRSLCHRENYKINILRHGNEVVN